MHDLCRGTPVILLVVTALNVPVQAQVLSKSIAYDDISREFTLYVPPNYDADMDWPLVINMHGAQLNGMQQMTLSEMNSVAASENFLVAYPDAIGGDWFGGQDNVGFIEAMIGSLESEYAINSSRIYATGWSQGGFMSYVLGALRPDRFAAIASVAGTPTSSIEETAHLFPPSGRPFPILQIHGSADTVVPYEGGSVDLPLGTFLFPPVEEFVGAWLTNNGSQRPIVFSPLPDVDTTDGTRVELFACSDCDTYTGVSGEEHVAEVLLYRIVSGGHNWPGDWRGWPDIPIVMPVSYDISASTEIWNFFQRHELAAIPEPNTLCLMATGLLGVLRGRKRRANQNPNLLTISPVQEGVCKI